MIIGITGGIGSGKSTIAQELARRDFAVYDCDREAKRIIAEDSEVRKAIVALLGEEAFVEGTYNTAYVSQRVFADKALLEKLNQIVHPAVLNDIKRFQTISNNLKPLFVESAILYEAGLDTLCDKVIVVDAPEEVRIARTIARDYGNDASPDNIDKVRARVKAQRVFSNQSSAVSFVVKNDGKTSIAEIVDKITHNMCKN
ncbi:MAG: dephospho-CoA kinase [Paludibacteraceae bacterium]|nr:dephospho-CoA kinase [Paludibacteraceae bacterium]